VTHDAAAHDADVCHIDEERVMSEFGKALREVTEKETITARRHVTYVSS